MRTAIVALAWIGVWALFSYLFDLDRHLLPGFGSTFTAIFSLLAEGGFWGDLYITMARLVPGNLVSFIVGVPIGIALAWSKLLRDLFEPPLSFFRGIPAASLFPVVIILFGIGDLARFALTLYVAMPLVIVTTMSGAMDRPETRIRREYLRLHSRRIAWWHYPACLLWDALPAVIGGLKVALALSLVIIIVSEMFFVGGRGIGWYTWDQYQAFNLPKMYACIVIVGIISFVLSATLDVLGSRLNRK